MSCHWIIEGVGESRDQTRGRAEIRQGDIQSKQGGGCVVMTPGKVGLLGEGDWDQSKWCQRQLSSTRGLQPAVC